MQKTTVANFHDFLACFEMLIRSVEQIGPWVVGRSGMRWDAATFGRSEGGGVPSNSLIISALNLRNQGSEKQRSRKADFEHSNKNDHDHFSKATGQKLS